MVFNMGFIDNPINEKTRGEIEGKIVSMGDYVKISYLQRALKSSIDIDARKFVLVNLAEIYKNKKMFLDAAKSMKSSAEINTTYKGKIKDFMKSMEFYIDGGDYNEADRIFAKSLVMGNTQEKFEMKMERKMYYFKKSEEFLKKDKRKNAKEIFERILSLEISLDERKDVQGKLLELYNKLGNIKEYYVLKNKIENI
jgi:tetratricopeptide (TPR) repeat protein